MDSSRFSALAFILSTALVSGFVHARTPPSPPPKPKAIFFDCDDCLYFDDWHVANRLTVAIENFCTNELGLEKGKAYKLYKEHGTALLGLLNENLLSRDQVDRYLKIVHDIGVKDHLRPDPKLRELLLRIDPSIKTYIFTASVKHHAVECLKALGIDDIFEDRIIDTKVCTLATKHSSSSFHAAMEFAGLSPSEVRDCVFFDDSVRNISTARNFGWRPILVGLKSRDTGKPVVCGDAEKSISTIHSLFDAVPELEVDANN
mmetsp:Transcript_16057/g.32931  ORF Transcript_16057/g.32931 Transcript_16057/m.32931 type:complete len:260 (-) Transcript_16057:23-802(-)